MKKRLFAGLAFAGISAMLCAETTLLECEDFQFQADWTKDHSDGQSVLFTDTSKTRPGTVFEVKDGGKYTVWASGFDVSNYRQGMRTFKVGANETLLPGEAGKHGKDGFLWEKMGEVDLRKGENYVYLQLKLDHARADAVIFSNDAGYDPNGIVKNPNDRRKIKQAPIVKTVKYDDTFPVAGKLSALKGGKKVGIKNAKTSILFTQAADESGKKTFIRSGQIFDGDKIVALPDFRDEALYLIKSTEAKYDGFGYYTRWNTKAGRSYIEIAGQKMELELPPNNPYCVGESTLLRITDVSRAGEDTLIIKYEHGAVGTMKLLPNGAIKFDVELEADETADYSLAFLGFNKKERGEFEALFLPTMYQGTRTMTEPKMVENRMVSHPLVILNAKEEDRDITNALVANPDMLPFEWSHRDRSFYGFSVSSPDSKVQAVIFQPILGATNSRHEEGQKVKASWYILSFAGDWTKAFEFSSRNIFKADVIREAYTCSFSDAVANIATLLKRGEISGWSPEDKGRWNIEAQWTATQSSPLSEVSISILTDDEDYYRNISLPSIEFALSRFSSHFAFKKPQRGGWVSDSLEKLRVPSGSTPGDVLAGINWVIGGGNPWMAKLYRWGNGKLRVMGGPYWTGLLGLYMAEPSEELLAEARKECDHWLTYAFNPGAQGEFNDVDPLPFINAGLYPYWWYLTDMYEITKDEKYLKYAKLGAYYTLSSLWAYPTPPEGDITIFKNNMVQGIRDYFWQGGKKDRLGGDLNFTMIKMLAQNQKIPNQGSQYVMPEKKVPAMQVSRIGLGIEQHWTYKWTDNYHNIINPSWAPNLLKVAQFTGDDLLMKYSRHSIIGRYANFPGYYIKDFTDAPHDPEYPYMGPDMTSFYWHHSPVHFGQSMDYLMAQVEFASKDKIKFPYVKQQGYVWFTNRIFGQPGKVFHDQLVRPLLDKRAVRPDSVKVSTLMGRGKDAIWAIVLNDSAKEMDVSLAFDSSAKAMRGAKTAGVIEAYNADGEKLPQTFTFFGDKKMKIPALSLVALRIPAEDYNPQIRQAPQGEGAYFSMKKLENGWDELHAFRIRGPFGKDSVFAVFTGARYREDAEVKMILKSGNSTQVLTRNFYPFEFSVYPIAQDEELELSFEISEKGREKVFIKDIILK